VLSRLDYGNAVLVGLPTYLVRRLQSVLNAAARLIYCMRSADHVTDALACLHWLRVPEWIDFKVAVLMYKFYMEVRRNIWDHSFLLPICPADGHNALVAPVV